MCVCVVCVLNHNGNTEDWLVISFTYSSNKGWGSFGISFYYKYHKNELLYFTSNIPSNVAWVDASSQVS